MEPTIWRDHRKPGLDSDLPRATDHFPSRFSGILKAMASLTFDTLKFAEKLIAAGVPEAQAKAQASALSEVLEINLKDVVTKDHLDYKLAELKTDIIKWVVAQSCQTSSLAAPVRLAWRKNPSISFCFATSGLQY